MKRSKLGVAALVSSWLLVGMMNVAWGQSPGGENRTPSDDRPIDRGSVILGGQVGLSYFQLEGRNATIELQLAPRALWFLAPGFAFGGSLHFDGSVREHTDAFQVGLGPSAAYYFDVDSPKNFPFVELNLAYLRSFTTVRSQSHEVDLGFSTGAAYFVARNVAVSAAIDFTTSWSQPLFSPRFTDWSRSHLLSVSARIEAFVF